jgi:peptidoglycan/LPS O-acetylase OafA/YrhL
MKKTDKPSYPSLYGLRAISILLVLFYHFGLPDLPQNLQWANPLFALFRDGQLGVNIFFVISGFLITSLLLQEEAAQGKISLKNFYIRRTLRIFPAYYFLLLVYAILQIKGMIDIKKDSWLTAVTYTKYFNWNDEHYTPHAWSLSVEEHFYLFWPPFFVYARRLRVWLLAALIFMVPILKFYDHFHDILWINDLTLFERIDAIAIGCLVAIYKDEIVNSMRKYWTVIFLAGITILLATTYQPEASSPKWLKGIAVTIGSTHGLVANLAIAAIVTYSVFGPRGLWFRLLNFRPLVYIGLLSYSLYLWQQFFAVNSDYWFTNPPWEYAAVFASALFSYYVIERPFLRLKSRFSVLRIRRQGKKQEVAAAGTTE